MKEFELFTFMIKLTKKSNSENKEEKNYSSNEWRSRFQCSGCIDERKRI